MWRNGVRQRAGRKGGEGARIAPAWRRGTRALLRGPKNGKRTWPLTALRRSGLAFCHEAYSAARGSCGRGVRVGTLDEIKPSAARRASHAAAASQPFQAPLTPRLHADSGGGGRPVHQGLRFAPRFGARGRQSPGTGRRRPRRQARRRRSCAVCEGVGRAGAGWRAKVRSKNPIARANRTRSSVLRDPLRRPPRCSGCAPRERPPLRLAPSLASSQQPPCPRSCRLSSPTPRGRRAPRCRRLATRSGACVGGLLPDKREA